MREADLQELEATIGYLEHELQQTQSDLFKAHELLNKQDEQIERLTEENHKLWEIMGVTCLKSR